MSQIISLFSFNYAQRFLLINPSVSSLCFLKGTYQSSFLFGNSLVTNCDPNQASGILSPLWHPLGWWVGHKRQRLFSASQLNIPISWDDTLDHFNSRPPPPDNVDHKQSSDRKRKKQHIFRWPMWLETKMTFARKKQIDLKDPSSFNTIMPTCGRPFIE